MTAQPALVVAGISVRAMAESARAAGWDVVALDLFGDRDTLRASRRWLPIGDAATLAIDPMALAAALRSAAQSPGVIGWVAGSGFEADPALLEAGGSGLPLLGMPAGAVAAVRDARHFFATLDRLGLAHPPVAFSRPELAHGWLAKRQGGSGGWHIRRAARHGPATADTYYQRFQGGEPMSALLLADGVRARVVALNRLLVHPLHGQPMVYSGAVGPVEDTALLSCIEQALARLVPAFELRGLASLDFIAAQGVPWLLEINARPSASMQLHDGAVEGGLMQAHVRAHAGALPRTLRRIGGVRGHRIVFASSPCDADGGLIDALDRDAHCHDVPAAAGRFAGGQPVCSVSAEGADAGAVERLLRQRCAGVRSGLLGRSHRHALRRIQ